MMANVMLPHTIRSKEFKRKGAGARHTKDPYRIKFVDKLKSPDITDN